MSRKTDGTSRGDRMKAYELPWQQTIPWKQYMIIRVDGKAFHSYTRKRDKPFDTELMWSMDFAAKALCEQVQGAKFAYVQSDEISLLVTNFNSMSEDWFGGKVSKIVSVSASIVTAAFNKVDGPGRLALFDSRVFTVPDDMEVLNYFLWRQRDCHINYVSMVAQSHFSPKQLHNKDTLERVKMLDVKGVDWSTFPPGAERGRVVVRKEREHETEYVDGRSGETVQTETIRHFWEPEVAPWFDWDKEGFVRQHTPIREQEQQ